MTITIKPAEATIHYAAELHSPFHHGAGSSGNTALLRRQEVVQPDGTVARVPFLSAASIRHALRDRIAWHLADTIQIERRSLPKGAVDLLWTGGAVTTTGAETDLDMIRRIEDLLPPVSLFGYAARSDIVEGKLRASDLILACRENAWRIHSGLIPDHALDKRAAAYTSDEFGTRHDIATSPAGQFVDDITAAFGVTSTQMIFETQVLKAGSWLSGSLYLTAGASEQEQRVLGAALELWAPGGMAVLGAKSAVGLGHARLHNLGDHADDLDWWTGHLTDNRDEILALIVEVSR